MTTVAGRITRPTTLGVGIKNWGIEMQDKAIGIVVFLLVGAGVAFLAAPGGEGAAGLSMGTITDALSNNTVWATAIVALTVAGMAMGVYSNGGLSGVDVRGAFTMLILASMVGGTFPTESWGAWLATAWILTGGGLLNKN